MLIRFVRLLSHRCDRVIFPFQRQIVADETDEFGKLFSFFFFFLFTSAGLPAAVHTVTVQKQFRKLLYKDYTDVLRRHMFAIYILITRVYN